MLVVLGIIGLVTAMSIPMLIPFMRGRKVRQASAMVKSACILARSRAVKQRKPFSVTILERERKVLVHDYEQLRRMLPVYETGSTADNSGSGTRERELLRESGNTYNRTGRYVTLISLDSPGFGQQRKVDETDNETLRFAARDEWTARSGWAYPGAGEEYAVGYDAGLSQVCPHLLANFFNGENQRDYVLTRMAVTRVRELPEGCRFDLDPHDGALPNEPQPDGWTYVFLPTGGVETLAVDARNEKGLTTTYQDPQTGEFSGPHIYGPDDRESATIIVYAMTGQAVSE